MDAFDVMSPGLERISKFSVSGLKFLLDANLGGQRPQLSRSLRDLGPSTMLSINTYTGTHTHISYTDIHTSCIHACIYYMNK